MGGRKNKWSGKNLCLHFSSGGSHVSHINIVRPNPYPLAVEICSFPLEACWPSIPFQLICQKDVLSCRVQNSKGRYVSVRFSSKLYGRGAGMVGLGHGMQNPLIPGFCLLHVCQSSPSSTSPSQILQGAIPGLPQTPQGHSAISLVSGYVRGNVGDAAGCAF